jgi:hypothetical protein
MQISRRTFLLTAAAAACSRGRPSMSPLARAVQYLWAQQAEDGGFHSSTYGLLRSGQSLTPFVLDALLSVAHASNVKLAGVDKALSFIINHTSADGELGRMDDTTADYPNYATALAVSAMIKAGRNPRDGIIRRMVEHLQKQQFNEASGWTRQDAPYGAWGMGGEIRRPPDAGHVDLSMTRCVLEALQTAGIETSDPAMTRALVYLERSQNRDGGFYFSTVNPDINKAGELNGSFASYGTATADGLLALRAAGIPDSDDRNRQAIQWLKEHHQPDRAPGFDGTARESWASGLRFYYAYVISRTRLGLLLSLPPQSADGSFRNANKMVKEDDPLIATACAVHALS